MYFIMLDEISLLLRGSEGVGGGIKVGKYFDMFYMCICFIF